MTNDRRRLGTRRGAERPALHPNSGEVARLLVGALGNRHALQPDIEPGGVHHREHVFEAAILLADAPADGPLVLAIGEDASRRSVDAELVLKAQRADVVARSWSPFVIGEEFRHEKQRDSPA